MPKMPNRGLQRWAIVGKTSGKVVVIANMRLGRAPTVDPAQFDTVQVGGDPRKLLPTDVRAGMVRRGDSFIRPDAA